MKFLLLTALASALAGCSALNTVRCTLPPGTPPAPRCHPAQSSTFSSSDGTPLPFAFHPAVGKSHPRGIVILIPGWDGVTCDYAPLTAYLRRHGYAVGGAELRGQIYDPVLARRGNPKDADAWVADLQSFTALVRRRHPGIPIFYHGHSFGGLIALQAAGGAGKKGPDGLIIHSPGFPFMMDRGSWLMRTALTPLACFRVPQLWLMNLMGRGPTGDPMLNCRWTSSDDRLREGYKVRYFIKSLELGREARISSRTLKVPVLALEGQKDKVVAGTRGAFKKYDAYLRHELAGGHADVISYPDGYHTLTESTTAHAALLDIRHWLDAHTR